MYFAPSPEFMKFYKTDKTFKRTVLQNVKRVLSRDSPNIDSVEECIFSNDQALRDARDRAKLFKTK